ncbi:uncharacterized mitochondrial protein AtMg00810-like [Lycium ferocissimum]|uniref:uncharacterized mitochondrial protein AtMg00810-like n=1 Tax=Lycium ferocissimum TaxID=112874 RepID=UPI002815D3E4|nr:uncharacterized mitochondrial protein AtMg00810-like [Lycium ferocissimum]
MQLPQEFNTSSKTDGQQACRLLKSLSVGTPVEANQKLTSTVFDKILSMQDEHSKVKEDALLDDPGVYQRLVGRLLYLTVTRPDVSFPVQNLSQFMHSPKQSRMEAAVRVVRYLKQVPGMRVLMSSNQLQTYYDADWASCPSTRRSISGYLVKLRDFLISWKSKKRATVSRSSTKAEYRSLASVMAKIEKIQLGLIQTVYLASAEQPADIFTKGLLAP